MAHVHYMYPTTFLNLHLKNTRKNSYTRKDIDFYDNKEFFDLLGKKSVLLKDELQNLSLRSQEGYLFINQSLYPPHQIRRSIDKRTHFGLMYCPKCLQEDNIPYFRKKWRYLFYTACPKHKIFLTDRCWHCYKPIKLFKKKVTDKIKYCSHCGADLSLTQTNQNKRPDEMGLEAIKWFEDGLNRGYFEINGQKVWSVMFFHIFCRLYYLLDREEKLFLHNFQMLNEYKEVCRKHEIYNSKKARLIYKEFHINSMIYHLFQNYPFNFLDFIKSNHLTQREFTHGLKYIPFWYVNLLSELIPKENKIGRKISEIEVRSAIKYLESLNQIVNQKNVAEIVGCHFTIHKNFAQIYKRINNYQR